LAGIVVVCGWVVVERFARRREARTDLRDAVNSFTKAVDEIRTTSVTVYGLSGSNPQARSLSATIRAKISALSDHLTTLESAGLSGDHTDLLKVFRQSVTGNDFESIKRKPLPANSPLYPEIAGNGEALARSIEVAMLSHLLKPQKISKIARILEAISI